MQHQVFITLLTKKFSGDIAAEELVQLNEWLEADIEHRKIADSFQQVWDSADYTAPTIQLSEQEMDAAFSKLMLRVENEKKNKPFFQILPGNLLRAAAMITALVCAVWAYRQWDSNEPAMLMVSAGNLEKKEVVLPDGSKVWLRKGTTLQYPESFDNDLRCVDLNGEAYFEVTHDPQRHFCVVTPNGEKVEVLGTSFNVRYAAKGSSVLVKTGKVRLNIGQEKEGVILVAGKKATYDQQTSKILVEEAVSFNELAWQSGHLEFIDVPVKQVIQDMEAYFNVKIEIENANLLNCTYRSPQLSNDLKQALASFCNTYKLEISNPAPDKFILRGGTCL